LDCAHGASRPACGRARLAFDAKEGKVSFEFEPRPVKAPAAKKAAAKKAPAA
jgi:DNA topoisomerase-3